MIGMKCKCGKDISEKEAGKDGLCFACSFKRILRDPKIAAEAKRFSRDVGHISYEDLNRSFTI
jgi:DNA-directed RNA polymerase subunit RPC12/RpoP